VQVPFYRHSLSAEDSQNIAQVLGSPVLTSGEVCKQVESQLSTFFQMPNVKLVNSWTNGAVATLLALDIGPGDEVIVPAMTFIATANVVELVGAKPVFVDVDPETLLIRQENILSALTENTKAIIPVHLYGQMCDIKSLREALRDHAPVYIIEDSAHTFEASFDGSKSGMYSDAAIFSFYATKNITCGEGGAIITKNDQLNEKIKQSVLHGMSAGASERFKQGQYRHWGMERLGTKANLPDLLAALLPGQITEVYKKLELRENVAKIYDDFFIDTPIRTPKVQKNIVHSRHLYPIGVDPDKRDQVLRILGEAGIGATVNYRAVPLMNFYQQKYNFRKGQFPVSEIWGEQTISLPLFPSLSESEQTYILETFEKKILPKLEGK